MPKHTCDDTCRVVNRDHTMVCSVTGQCFGQYMSRNYHNDDAFEMLVRRPARPPKRQRPGLDLAKVAPAVRTTYELLLWGEPRKRLEGATAAVGTAHHKKRRLLRPAPRDEELQRAVCDAVADIVRVVAEHKPFTKLNTVVLGALYLMQHGKRFTTAGGTQWDIPRFEHLQRHLPSISDLPSFGFNRSLVRVGKNTIMAAARTST